MFKNKSKWLSKKYTIFLIIIFLVGFLLFYLAYTGMKDSTGIGYYNKIILSWLSTHRNPFINEIMQIATTTASPTFFVIAVSIIAFTWSYKKREIWRPLILSLAVIISALTSSLFKVIFKNSRPINTDMVPPFELGYSFPSGHTLSTIVFLLVIGYLFYSRYKNSDKFFWLFCWVISTILGTLIIALSRLYLGYHWFTDIIASIGLGLIIFAIIIIIDKYFVGHYKRSKVKI